MMVYSQDSMIYYSIIYSLRDLGA